MSCKEQSVSVPRDTVERKLYKKFDKRRKEGRTNKLDELLFKGYVNYLLNSEIRVDADRVVDEYLFNADKDYLEEYRYLSSEHKNLSDEELIEKLDPMVVRKAPNGKIAVMLY